MNSDALSVFHVERLEADWRTWQHRWIQTQAVIAAVLLVLCQAGDVLSTHWGLARGASEANPVADALLARGLLAPVKMTVIWVIAARVLWGAYRRPERMQRAVRWLWAIDGIMLAVIASNLVPWYVAI